MSNSFLARVYEEKTASEERRAAQQAAAEAKAIAKAQEEANVSNFVLSMM